jgi:probable rRNA maturation factor
MKIQVHTNKQVSSSLKKPIIRLVTRLIEILELQIAYINVIFVTDSDLKELHRKYLNEDSETDVMTFNLNESVVIEGEIYISAARAAAQAKEYDVTDIQEICRLVIHGCLHLAGYSDTDELQKIKMKLKEDVLTDSLYKIFDSLNN